MQLLAFAANAAAAFLTESMALMAGALHALMSVAFWTWMGCEFLRTSSRFSGLMAAVGRMGLAAGCFVLLLYLLFACAHRIIHPQAAVLGSAWWMALPALGSASVTALNRRQVRADRTRWAEFALCLAAQLLVVLALLSFFLLPIRGLDEGVALLLIILATMRAALAASGQGFAR